MEKRDRPKSDNPRSFTVPEVRLTKEEQRMFILKAGHFGGSTAALIRKAVEAYDPKMPENQCCGRNMEVFEDEVEFPFRYGDNECVVIVKNVPTWRCNQCGEVEMGLSIAASAEKIAEQEFESFLYDRDKSKNIPDEITLDFNQLML